MIEGLIEKFECTTGRRLCRVERIGDVGGSPRWIAYAHNAESWPVIVSSARTPTRAVELAIENQRDTLA